MIGDGPQRDGLERQAQTLDASDRITATGVLDEHEDILAQMKAARVFAFPSMREGFGITSVEADTIDRSHGERIRRFDDLLARLEEAV